MVEQFGAGAAFMLNGDEIRNEAGHGVGDSHPLVGLPVKTPDSSLLDAYLISGGSPPACLSLLDTGTLEPYVIGMVRDWVYGALPA